MSECPNNPLTISGTGQLYFNTVAIEDLANDQTGPYIEQQDISDDFNASSLDNTKWRPHQFECSQSNSLTSISCFNEPVFTNGRMNLVIRRENPEIVKALNTCDPHYKNVFKAFSISNGLITSYKRYGYGKYEIKCRIPRVVYQWPSFWLYGECGKEIDVFEFLQENFDNTSYASKYPYLSQHIHLGCGDAAQEYSPHYRPCDNTVDLSLADHIYAVEWTPFRLQWLIDNAPVFTIYRYFIDYQGIALVPANNRSELIDLYNKYYNEFGVYPTIKESGGYPIQDNLGMYIILSVGYGRDWDIPGGEILLSDPTRFPDDGTGTLLNSQMEIDYFKYFKRSDCVDEIKYCNNPEIYQFGNTQKANIFSLGGAQNCNLQINQFDLHLKALDYIELLDGFSAIDNFSAEISVCENDFVKKPMSTNSISNSSNSTISTNFQNRRNIDNSIPSNGEIIIYPNPSESISSVNISNSTGVSYDLEIKNTNMAIVYKEKGIGNARSINSAPMLESGIYYFYFSSPNSPTIVKKHIVIGK